MGDDRGRFLVNIHGATHELFGGDPEEIVLRIRPLAEGAPSPADLALDLRTEANRYERLHRGGWRMVSPFADGAARCRKTAKAGAPAAGRATGPVGSPPKDLADVLEGAADLPEAAARLRAAAAAFGRAGAAGRGVSRPAGEGDVPPG